MASMVTSTIAQLFFYGDEMSRNSRRGLTFLLLCSHFAIAKLLFVFSLERLFQAREPRKGVGVMTLRACDVCFLDTWEMNDPPDSRTHYACYSHPQIGDAFFPRFCCPRQLELAQHARRVFNIGGKLNEKKGLLLILLSSEKNSSPCAGFLAAANANYCIIVRSGNGVWRQHEMRRFDFK